MYKNIVVPKTITLLQSAFKKNLIMRLFDEIFCLFRKSL